VTLQEHVAACPKCSFSSNEQTALLVRCAEWFRLRRAIQLAGEQTQ
jgi:hypothetical protein